MAKESKPERQINKDDFKRVPWRSIGPAIMGGRIADMCFQPGDPKTYYVGYASGGLWVTKNLGTTFQPIFDKEETSSIGSVVCCDAPQDWAGWDKSVKKSDRKEQGAGKIIWVGTGEGNGRNSSSWGNGVYRSTDGGKTWDHLGLEDSHDIPRLAVHPDNPDVCYVAALGHLWGSNEMRGLYKTIDGGKNWSKVLSIDSKTGCIDVILDPKNPDTVYAAMYSRLRTPYSFTSGGDKGGLFKSTDGGKTWKKLTKGLPKKTGRFGLDIYASDPNKLIAVVEATDGGANSIRDDRMYGGGVFRSDDGGESWRRCSHRSPRAFYFSKIKFDPNNEQRVYMLGWTTEVSDDGGETFRGGWADILHADHHAILVNPQDSKHIIIGTDGGASQTFDGGETWDFMNQYPAGQFYNISLDNSDPYRVIGGLQDNGTWVFPSATTRNWPKDEAAKVPDTGITNADIEFVLWGDGFHAEFDPSDSNTVYGEWQGGNLTRVDLKSGERYWCIPEAREGQARYRFNWNSPFLFSSHHKDTIYLGGNMVFRLTNRGENWEAISPDLTTKHPDKMTTVGSNAETYCTLVSLVESPLKSGVLWAGSDDGIVSLTLDDGKTWGDVTPKNCKGRYVSRLHASSHDPSRCYVSLDGHRSDDMSPCIMATDDLGKTWKEITANLPDRRSVMVVREDIWNPEVLYCGTEGGLHVSTNRGSSWISLHGKGLPTVPVYDIKQHAREGDLVLGTHGRSVWVLDDARWISQLSDETIKKGLHLFELRDITPRWLLAYNGLWSHKMFRAANPPLGLKIDYWISEYTGDDVSIVIKNSEDVTIKKLSGGNGPGFNRVVWNLQPDDWHKLADKGEEMMMNDFYARPGEYKLELSMGEMKEKGTFRILEKS